MTRTFARLACAASISVAILAGGSGIAQATSPSATLTVSPRAQLQPDGSAVVTVTYSCLPGTFLGATGDIFLDLEQTQAIGSADVPATCDDSTHTTTLDAAPGAFAPGTASALVQLTASNATANAQAEVTIR